MAKARQHRYLDERGFIPASVGFAAGALDALRTCGRSRKARDGGPPVGEPGQVCRIDALISGAPNSSQSNRQSRFQYDSQASARLQPLGSLTMIKAFCAHAADLHGSRPAVVQCSQPPGNVRQLAEHIGISQQDTGIA